ncbi:MAG: hypothetical protein K1X75_06140 [Leptospirales bacterium]|nr:hypothetical protein [Leptospirales bacterium]
MNPRIALCAFAVCAFSAAAAAAPLPEGGYLPLDAAQVYGAENALRCNFDNMHLGPRDSFHAMWIGDSVGALHGVEPASQLAWRVGSGTGAIVNKRWENFMTNPPPRTGPVWRILNTAIPGQHASIQRKFIEDCLGDNAPAQARSNFDRTAPYRVIMEIGGNDIRDGVPLVGINPHYAHYQLNAILNHIGRMIALLQQNGRTVLLVGYHPYSASTVVGDIAPKTSLLEPFCGVNTPGLEVISAAGGLVCAINGTLLDAVGAIANPIFDLINKQRRWLYDTIGYRGFERGLFPFVQYNSDFMRFFRGVDHSLGRLLGMNTSLTGLFEDPAARFQQRNEKGLNGYFDRLKHGMPWMDFWNLIQETPRYETGWAVMYALPNKSKAVSAMIVMLGRRIQENYVAQGVPIPGTSRRTVEYVSMEPYFQHPYVEWAGRNELYHDDVHPNAAGAQLWADVLSAKMRQLDYDIYLNDFDFTQNNWRDWSEAPIDPYAEDLALLIACFFFGYCK